MKIAICDDENVFIRELKPLVYTYGNEHRFQMIIDTFKYGERLLASPVLYDVIFLDYQMNGINGMETAKALRKKNVNSTIIFVTSYPDFVYEAFTVDTFRFLQKPVTQEMVNETLDGYFAKFGSDYPIVLRSNWESIVLETSDIIFLESFNQHCLIHTYKNGILDIAKTMMTVGFMLPRNHFYKISKSFIVNFNYVDKFTNEVIEFTNGEKAYISVNYITAFKVAFKKYFQSRKPY